MCIYNIKTFLLKFWEIKNGNILICTDSAQGAHFHRIYITYNNIFHYDMLHNAPFAYMTYDIGGYSFPLASISLLL